MSWLLFVAALLFGISGLLVVIRITVGPTMLDRAISFDVLVSIAIGGIAVDAAVDRNTESVPILLVATLLGFVGSVSIARFTPGSDDVDDDDSPEPSHGTRPGGRL